MDVKPRCLRPLWSIPGTCRISFGQAATLTKLGQAERSDDTIIY
ncbi:MAG: hypothetical protein ACMUIS_10475 [bacterium]